jgi:serine/threonine-protein phosphatase 4 regulatory subunit 1
MNSMTLVSAAAENIDATPPYVHEDMDVSKHQSWLQTNEDRRFDVQDVIPQALLDQYLLMTNPFRAQLMLRLLSTGHTAHQVWP